ncbi:MAG: DUF2891 domain-containing protein [Pseudomonadota bacterium]
MFFRQRLLVLLLGIAALTGLPNALVAQGAMSTSEISRFTQLALDCIPQEYPNKLNQLLGDASHLRSPKELHPAFFGCYDWHSSVHGHWMLVKALKEYADLPNREAVVRLLQDSITAGNIAAELAYLKQESKSWERMYGWAWLLQLQNELTTWDDPRARIMATELQPLSDYLRDRYMTFLPIQSYPVRTGVHPNTAFGMSFAYDYAKAVGDDEFAALLTETAKRYFGDDQACPIDWEPSGEDFLSACLEEAALMSRVMKSDEFQGWFTAFLPGLADHGTLTPADVSDRTDPKIVHLDGLNLSRAWSLYVIADAVPNTEVADSLRTLAEHHLAASLPFVTGDHYVGSHWLGSFAIYALTRRH